MTEHLRTLEKEDAHIQAQIFELGRRTPDLCKDVHDLMGQRKGMEKRLANKDKLIEATIRLRITEEVEKLRAEFRRPA